LPYRELILYRTKEEKMMDEAKYPKPDGEPANHWSRRTFVTASLAVGIARRWPASTGLPVVEADVDVETPDGTCDAVFIHPATGSHPGVLVWHDSPGLRPVIRDLGKRMAEEGYSVLVPNLFYRARRAPVFDETFDYAGNPADRQKYARTVAHSLRREQPRETPLPTFPSWTLNRRWTSERRLEPMATASAGHTL
jgi:dienelactone hydrolase family protein